MTYVFTPKTKDFERESEVMYESDVTYPLQQDNNNCDLKEWRGASVILYKNGTIHNNTQE